MSIQRIKVEYRGYAGVWIAGRLFTIGFPRLPIWKGITANVIWPYFVGSALGGLVF